MTRKINEIFYSLQGEGALTGTPALFIRFSGCNLQCPFCDTQHQQGTLMTDEEIIGNAARSRAPLIVLTGGEPSLWIDADFIDALKKATGARISIETNGTHPVPDNIDWVTVSPKTGICGPGPDLPVTVGRADEIKVVYTGQDLDQYFTLPCRTPQTQMFLQPCHVDDPAQNAANTAATVDAVLRDPRWRLSLQTHRLLNIP